MQGLSLTRTETHTIVEDLAAIITGTLLAALGVLVLSKAGLVTGGLVGVALLLHQSSHIGFSIVFATINLPFYILAVRKKGWGFTLKTFGSVLLLAYFSELIPSLLHLEGINPVFAAAAGGLLTGVGLLILFRHNASLGGFNILCLYLQERSGIRTGISQLIMDCTVLLLFAVLTNPLTAAVSLIATAILNLTLANNHRAGRYLGKSIEQS